MKMKLFITSFALMSLFISSANAQAHAQKSSAIIRGGINFANVTVNDDGDIDDAKVLTSFQVGIIGDLNIAPFLAIQPGLIFTGKGSKTQTGNEGDVTWSRATSNPYYLEVPVNLVFKTVPAPVRFIAGAGPYIGFGVGGKNKTRGAVLGINTSSEESIEWSNDNPSTLNEEEGAGFGIMRRFDYGLNGLIGIEASHVVITANFGLGLAKLQSGSNSGEDNNNKHRVFSLTFGLKL